MISFSMRALLPVSFLIALGSGCAHRNKPAAAASPSPTTSAPSSTVTSEDIAKAPGQSIEQVLMGRFPGVDVSRTADGGFAVRIRGGSSIRSGNTPLYVLDGERGRSEEHTSELQSRLHLVCRLLLEKKKKKTRHTV